MTAPESATPSSELILATRREMPREACRIVDAARARGIVLRLMGGVAVRARLVNGSAKAQDKRPAAEDPALAARAPEQGKTWVALQVIDTGTGVAPADQERIFDEFEPVDAGPRGESMGGTAAAHWLRRLPNCCPTSFPI